MLRLVVTGALNKQIAAEFGITKRTVKQHRGRGIRKLGIVSVAELVQLADRIDPEKVGTSNEAPLRRRFYLGSRARRVA